MAIDLKKVITGLSAAAGITATLLVMPYEGMKNQAYYDPPKVATICYGHTGGVKITDKATDDECAEYLIADITVAEEAVDSAVKVRLPDKTKAAFIDFVYNAGAGNFKKSTMLKKINAGNLAGACRELSKWVYAAGVKLNGLARRRGAEEKLCLEGLQ